jgi:hypothetical protein
MDNACVDGRADRIEAIGSVGSDSFDMDSFDMDSFDMRPPRFCNGPCRQRPACGCAPCKVAMQMLTEVVDVDTAGKPVGMQKALLAGLVAGKWNTSWPLRVMADPSLAPTGGIDGVRLH